MSRPGRGFWGALFGSTGERERFSIDELRHLHSVLLRNQVVTDANRDTIVEALRSIAELVIWGDQHDPSMVEYFLTENLLGHFNQILLQRSNRRGNVATQVLQTLSILIQNVRNQQTVYYLFSNNHINEIVSMRFDFEDDEVLGYYVNLLKTISLKLNEVTVQFFFQQLPDGGATFPLYTEAVKFVNHRDGMVRTAVKTLTLNVYAIPLPAVQRFVTQRPASNYLEKLGSYVAEQCQVLDRLLSSWDVTSPQAPASVEACLAEIEDLLSYFNDVLATGVPVLQNLLVECLWRCFVGPVLFWPLIQEDIAAQHIAALNLSAVALGVPVASMLAQDAGMAQTVDSMALGLPHAVEQGIVGPLCSLYVLERLLHAIMDQAFLGTILAGLLGGVAAGAGVPPGTGISSLLAPSPPSPVRLAPSGEGVASVAAAGEAAGVVPLPAPLLVRLQYSPAVYRATFLGMLRGSDPQLAAAAVRVLAALVRSQAVGEDLLELLGLLPRRRKKQRQLLAALTATPASSLSLPTTAAAVAAAPAGAAKVAAAICSRDGEECLVPVGAVASGMRQAGSGQQAELQQRLDDAHGVLSPQLSNNGCGSAGGGNVREVEADAYSSHSPRHLLASVVVYPSENGGSPFSSGSPLPHPLSLPAGAVDTPVPQCEGSSSPPQFSPGGTGVAPDAGAPGSPIIGGNPAQDPSWAHAAAAGPPLEPVGGKGEPNAGTQASTVGSTTSGSVTAYGEAQFCEIVAALLGLLGGDHLPPLALLTLGWLLNQLLSVGATGAELAPNHVAILAGAVQHAQRAAATQLEGPWCDVIGTMVEAEWGRARVAVLRSGGSSLHAAVHTWMQVVLVQDLRWRLADKPQDVAAASAPTAAKLALVAVQTLVALTQTQQLLLDGEVLPAPPIARPPRPGPSSAAPAAVAAMEIAERSHIVLSHWLSCVVAFARGEERQVYFAVEGLPAYVKAAALGAPAPLAADGQEGSQGGTAALARGRPEALAAAVAGSAPVVVVADPGSSPNTGVVLSAAPLLGAFPCVDQQHSKWLHVQVRPQARALLKVLAASHPGSVLPNLESQLVSGHWVLAFPTADKAHAAAQLVEESAAGMRALHRQLLLPLLGEKG